jgi:NitT/TauT family transport system ATP-binding protein
MEFNCIDLCKSYHAKSKVIPALQDVILDAGEQEFLCIVGPSGCGKTTLLKTIAGLIKPSSGSIDFAAPPPHDRPRSALVFQDHGLFPWMTVLDNVAFGLEMRKVSLRERRDQARSFIEKVGLTSFAKNYPDTLSIGMRQRVGIARAFVSDPQILLMDEPFGSLDAQTRLVLQEELLRIWKDQKKLVVHVTHDIEEAILLGDRVVVMTGRPGHIKEEIPITLDRPRDLSNRNRIDFIEIKEHVWRQLKDEVRESLSIPS